MLMQEMNDRLTRVGPGTPMGNLLRSYWHPVGAVSELGTEPVQPVRLLGISWASGPCHANRKSNFAICLRAR